MKRLLAMILAWTLVFGCIPVHALAEETTEPSVASTEETVTEPVPVTVSGISVATTPSKTVYQVGDMLDPAGGSISVAYSDGTTQTVDMTADMVSGFNNTIAYTQTLTVTYEGFEAYFDVTVNPAQDEPNGNTESISNTTPDESEPVTPDLALAVENPAAQVDAGEKEISWISFTTPTKIQYVVNQDELDLTGGTATIHYTDDTEETIPMTEDMVSGFDNNQVGTRWLQIEYLGWSGDYKIAVVESEDSPIVMEVSWKSKPSKLVYYVNQPLDLNGAVLLAEYSDGNSQEIAVTQDMVWGFSTASTGSRWLNIDFDGNGTDISIDYQVVTAEMLTGNCGPTTFWELDRWGYLRIWGTGEITPRESTYDRQYPWEPYRSAIKTISIEGEITTIPVAAFQWCENLENVYWNQSITEIGSHAFYNCKNLSQVTLPEGLTYLGYGAFSNCTGLTQIALPSGISELGYNVWEDCTGLTQVSLPNDLTEIPQGMFEDCTGLTAISLPESVTDISYRAFYGCTGLTEITFPKNLEYLGNDAFSGCTGLKKITFEGKESPSGNDIFDGVTATGYYPGTQYWSDWFFDNCGGDIEWINTGDVAKSIAFERTDIITNVGHESYLSVVAVPSYVALDIEFTVDNDVVTIGDIRDDYCYATAQKVGTAIVTARDKISGCSANVTITAVEPQNKDISCPYEEVLQIDNGYMQLQYSFTPEKTGNYVFSISSDAEEIIAYREVGVVYLSDEGEETWLQPVNYGSSGETTYRQRYVMEAGVTYIINAYISPREGQSSNAVFRLSEASAAEGIEILDGVSTVYGVAGQTLWGVGSLRVNVYPESAAEEVIWESSDPELMEVYYDPEGSGAYSITTHGEGSAVLTAKCGDFSDSITVTTQKPKSLSLNTPIQQKLQKSDCVWYSFTPSETGRYAFVLENADERYYYGYFSGEYRPTDELYTINGITPIRYGTFTAGVTYYYSVHGYSSAPESNTSITVKKEETIPAVMEVICNSAYGNHMSFSVTFVPSNAYDNIVSWESSNTDILDTGYYYNGSGTSCSFDVYGSGEVTITAVSESGLRASTTVTVGECYDGHTYGPWKQTKAPTCMIDGMEAATCICGMRKYQPIPAIGHRYDNNCDADCNECGEIRTVTHDFTEKWGYTETVHWHICTICGERSEMQNHTPGAAATENAPQTCEECGCVLKSALGHSHSYGTELTVDETGHWYACSGCNARKNYNAHKYTNVCDADCNDCGYTRKNVHVNGGIWVSDKAGHWQACTECNTKLNYAAHVPGAAATSKTPQICSICRYEIQKATGTTTTNTTHTTTTIVQQVTKPSNHTHSYSTMLTMDEVGHWYGCAGCTSKKEYQKHTYKDDCDADCDTCGYTRAVSHATEATWSANDSGHWYACKTCGEKINFAAHKIENGSCMICKHAVAAYDVPNEIASANEESEDPNPMTGYGPYTEQNPVPAESSGIPWWMMIVAGFVSSLATLGVVGVILWVNRKKIAAMFLGK